MSFQKTKQYLDNVTISMEKQHFSFKHNVFAVKFERDLKKTHNFICVPNKKSNENHVVAK